MFYDVNDVLTLQYGTKDAAEQRSLAAVTKATTYQFDGLPVVSNMQGHCTM